MTLNPKARELMARINKKAPGSIAVASEVKSYPRITTGSLGLDLALGGGWPANQWHEIIGENSAGKTALAFMTIAANQQRDPEWTAMFCAAEEFVPEYAQMWGVDLDRLIVYTSNIMEEVYGEAEEFMDERALDAVVIDSLPALVPAAEDEKDMDEHTVGRGALLTGKFFRKIGKATKRSLDGTDKPVVGLMLNQYRMKIGVMHGDPRTTPGGEAKNYAYFTRVEVKRDEWIEVGPSGNRDRIGQVVRALTLKNKSAPPQQKAFYDIYFEEGGPVPPGNIDHAKEIVTLALLFDLVNRSGGWISYGDRKWQGKDNFLASVREEVGLATEIEAAVYATLTRKNAA